MKTRTTTTMALALIAAASATASASPVIYGAASSGTTSVLHGNNRELTRLGFSGTSSFMTGSNFLHWHSGSLTNNSGTYGWTAQVPRDVNSANVYTGNPDRADGSTPMPGELAKTGSMQDVFGSFGGYKNMSYIIDGEDNGAYTFDLLLAQGMGLAVDNNNATVEISVLERGGNSDFNIYGIRVDNSLTGPIFVGRSLGGNVGWNLDTLEIGGAQRVVGVGISLDASWSGIKGIRIEAKNGFNGPDIVAVGVAGPTPLILIPTPGALALLGLGGLVATRRRR